jgi:hypothetical protein
MRTPAEPLFRLPFATRWMVFSEDEAGHVPPVPFLESPREESVRKCHLSALWTPAPANHSEIRPIDVGRIVERQLLPLFDHPRRDDRQPGHEAVGLARVVDVPGTAVLPWQHVPVVVDLERVGPEPLWDVPYPPWRASESCHPGPWGDVGSREEPFALRPRIADPHRCARGLTHDPQFTVLLPSPRRVSSTRSSFPT